MLLTLWRHGEAGFAATDEVRALTPRGRVEVVAMAKGYVAWAGVSGLGPVSLLLHSPYQRTVETAELLGEQLRPCSQKVDLSLAPGAHPEAFSENDYTGHGHVVMVSHLDLLAQLEHVAQVHERRVCERRRARGHAAVLFAERRELWVDIRVV